MVDLVVENGTVVTSGGRFHGGVAVEGERIVALGPDATLPRARRVIDAEGRFVLPRLIDAQVHMASVEDPSMAESLRANMPRETEGALYCLCEVSIYRGQRFRGLARTTIVRGRVMMEDRQTVGAPGWGRHLPRGGA